VIFWIIQETKRFIWGDRMSTYLILSIMLFGHVICDFYLFQEKLSKYKAFSVTTDYYKFVIAHGVHALAYGVLITGAIAVWLSLETSLPEIIYSNGEHYTLLINIFAVLVLSHLIIDLLQEYIQSYSNLVEYSSLIFMIDQFLHVAVMFWLALDFFYQLDYAKPKSNIHLELLTVATCLTSFFLLLRPASKFITLFMSSKKIGGVSDKIQITKSFLAGVYYAELAKHYSEQETSSKLHAELSKSKEKADKTIVFLKQKKLEVNSNTAFDSNGAGKWIGYIERVMIFVFFIFNQPAAIAGIMAIKTAFRFNDLKDDNDSARSEYIMIGTFISFFITMIIAATAKFAIESIWDGSGVKILDFDILHWLSTYVMVSGH
jgi:hypothetical protein